jgi:dihydroorotate dehydrogenase (NAD+) catalytic subunit
MATMQNNLKTSFCGMALNSPIILLSGCVGFGEEYTRIKGFSNSDIGAVCLKGTTLEPRLGNKLHRIAETPNGMLNAIGLQNPGTDAVINDIMPGLDKKETRFIIFLDQPLKNTVKLQGTLMTLILMQSKSIFHVQM